ncbi:MAG: MBL fold metallo-hydrolase [Desulfobacteraceae bacterium]|jgi:glyoxylase-like metal-dependent hydrolase (beta-lactamase superfamily II)|nr:MBL fold metallo-hydrolase [Desulfobacteraceae bacterium]MDD3991059.1 MBL fold metallo-hydrolase [Desulfobacteraceae bacterium]
MISETVHRIRLGITNCYLMGHPRRWVLVDAGCRGRQGTFFRRLKRLGIGPGDIRLIVVTHVHFDHVGSLAAIRERCGCPVAVHAAEAPLLKAGRIVLPPGTGEFSRRLIAFGQRHPPMVASLYRFDPVIPEIIVEHELDLRGYGVEARVLHTPGHTAGSLTVLTASGHAAVGDLAFGCRFFGANRHMPPFADSLETIAGQWRKLGTAGARWIHPGHGCPFAVRRLLKTVARQ